MTDEEKIKSIDSCIIEIRYFTFGYRVEGMGIEDQMQELKLHLFKKLDLFDPSKSSLQTFANRITRNKCIDLDRCLNKQKRTEVRKRKKNGG